MKNNSAQAVLALISLGPGDLSHMTVAAQAALQSAEVVIGYQLYLDLVRPLLRPGQEIMPSPIGREMERAAQAVELAAAGRSVALVSSGDIGIYAMAGPVFEVLRRRDWSGHEPEVMVFPGVSAMQAAAARLGAPLGHDFCAISLSDLLTPWPLIERRLQAAAWGDFVIALYNPRSQKRNRQLPAAIEILLAYRPATTPVAVARQVTRPDEQVTLTTLAELDPGQVDMFTLVLVGNSQSYVLGEYLATPRGYGAEAGRRGAAEQRSGGGGEVRESEAAETKSRLRPCALAPLPAGGDVYPISLIHMAGKQAVVVGGGAVGQRKVQGLLAAGAGVRLISPEATPQLQDWVEAGQIQWTCRPYQPGDLAGAELVFAAANRREVNAQVAQEAKMLGLLCNVADRPAEGNFHVPAVHRRPDLVVAVSTNGQSPTRAREVRDEIAGWLEEGRRRGSGGAEEQGGGGAEETMRVFGNSS